MTGPRQAATGLLVIASMLGGWTLARGSGAERGPAAATSVQPEPTDAEYDSSTVAVRGVLSPAARSRIAPHARDGRALLIVLRGEDRLVCEDLGRQLRELLRRAGRPYPALLLVASEDADAYRRFIRREHVPAAIETIAADELLESGGDLATPAVLVTHDTAQSAEGVGHTRRFPNVRLRSFAKEVAPLLR